MGTAAPDRGARCAGRAAEPLLPASRSPAVHRDARRPCGRPDRGHRESRAQRLPSGQGRVLRLLRVRRGRRGGAGTARRGRRLAPRPRAHVDARPNEPVDESRVRAPRRRVRRASGLHDAVEPAVLPGSPRAGGTRPHEGSAWAPARQGGPGLQLSTAHRRSRPARARVRARHGSHPRPEALRPGAGALLGRLQRRVGT